MSVSAEVRDLHPRAPTQVETPERPPSASSRTPGIERLQVASSAGVPISATLFNARRGSQTLVVINPAMLVPQRFYWGYARFLATAGFSALTWDYPGVGMSSGERVRSVQRDLDEWATDDFAAILNECDARAPRTLVVGHSFGGQMIAMPANRHIIKGALLVACPSGHYGHWSGPRRLFMAWLAHFGLPALSRVSGCFPAKRLKLGENLPREAALQWGRWMRAPDYLESDTRWAERTRSLDLPIRAVSFTDDRDAPPSAIAAMTASFRGARITESRIDPESYATSGIGHLGFFRGPPALWNDSVLWLRDLIDRQRYE